MKSLYDAINHFWTETEVSPLPPSASLLYHFLCYKANRQYWQMLVKCSTDMVAFCLQVSCPTVRTAREKLAARGFISYVQGKRKSAYAEYTILDKPTELHDLTQETHQQQDLTPNLPQSFPQNFPQSFPQDFPQNFPINKKKEEKENNISNINAREEKISLKELEEKLSADAEWLSSVSVFIASCGFGTLNVQQVKDHLHRFFQYLLASGQNEREETDTRRYFNNWLRVQLKNNNSNGNTTKETTADRRRSFDIGTTSEKNYHSSL